MWRANVYWAPTTSANVLSALHALSQLILKRNLLLFLCVDLKPESESIQELAQGHKLVQEELESRHRWCDCPVWAFDLTEITVLEEGGTQPTLQEMCSDVPLWSMAILLSHSRYHQCFSLSWTSTRISHRRAHPTVLSSSADHLTARSQGWPEVAVQGCLSPGALMHWWGLIWFFLITFSSD